MSKLIYKRSRGILKNIDEKDHTITMYASTGSIDRDNEIADIIFAAQVIRSLYDRR
jgi:hypothetical protein